MKWYNVGVVRGEISISHGEYDEEIKLLNRVEN